MYPDIPDYIDQKWTFQIAFDHSYNLWIAGPSGCSYYNFKTKKARRFFQGNTGDFQLSDNFITSVFIDSRDFKWIGSRNGLNVVQPGVDSVIYISKKDGLPNNQISAITEDKFHNIWISSINGLSVIHMKDFPKNVEIHSYSIHNGLATNIFSRNCTDQDWTGKLFLEGFQDLRASIRKKFQLIRFLLK
ncbi:MAG: hypothetical protein HC905_32135 [Bacteroidales bacterium]|nr:hypothetical protein [Bacteroidales bacterium]